MVVGVHVFGRSGLTGWDLRGVCVVRMAVVWTEMSGHGRVGWGVDLYTGSCTVGGVGRSAGVEARLLRVGVRGPVTGWGGHGGRGHAREEVRRSRPFRFESRKPVDPGLRDGNVLLVGPGDRYGLGDWV